MERFKTRKCLKTTTARESVIVNESGFLGALLIKLLANTLKRITKIHNVSIGPRSMIRGRLTVL